ncbi:MAG: MopE-related protein [Pseudomonadota bacterium]
MFCPRRQTLASLGLLFALLAPACGDATVLTLRLHGEAALPALRAPDDVQRLQVQVRVGSQLIWSRPFDLAGPSRVLDETLVLRPGDHAGDSLDVLVIGLHEGVEITRGHGTARFVAGENTTASVALEWDATVCLDVDGDAYGRGPACLGADCEDGDVAVHVGAGEQCNGRDDDCDDSVDEAEDLTPPPCARVLGVCTGAVATCGGIAGWQACPDAAYGLSYERVEHTCDGLDNDCDGTTDPGCQCMPGQTRSCEGLDVGACDPGEQQCQAVGSAWEWRAQCVGTIGPATETCNELDDDCDGEVDEDFDLAADPLHCGACTTVCDLEGAEAICVDGQCALGRCEQGHHDLDGIADNGCEYACLRTLPDETCNGRDDDCNGVVDDVTVRPACALTQGVCLGAVPECGDLGGRAHWLACDYGAHYEPVETRCDGMDNDCDGQVDEGVQCPSCVGDGDCDDANPCTQDSCQAQLCRFVARDEGATCSDGLFCTTLDRCDHSARCVAPGPSPCTTECQQTCDEDNDRCLDDAAGVPCTTDGQFCNGAEVCDGGGLCVHAGDPCPPVDCQGCDEARDRCVDPLDSPCTDDGLFCNGGESCNGSGQCVHAGDPCPGTLCETCQETTDSCLDPVTSPCEDGVFCTGGDHCDGSGGCVAGTGTPCTTDCLSICDEVNTTCLPDDPDTPCSDDGLFCNGAEFCDGTGLCLPEEVSPCAETECKHCQEGPDTCLDPPTTPCDDGNGCTYLDTCDALGSCVPGAFDNNVDGDLFINAACGGTDCNDADPAIPGPEGPICDEDRTCADGVDNDCDTLVDLLDSNCAGSGYFCLYAPRDSVATGPPGDFLRIHTDQPGIDPSRLFCFTDASRQAASAVLGQDNFESGMGFLMTSTPSQVSVDAAAQSPLSSGSLGLKICTDAQASSPAIATTGLQDIVLRYALQPDAFSSSEYIVVEYSIDGGAQWHLLNVFGDTYQTTFYRSFSSLLPAEAEDQPDLRVRFRTLNMGGTHCAKLDDVVLEVLPPPTLRVPLHRARFEPAEGFPGAGLGSGISPYTVTGSSSYTSMQTAAQNPATQDALNTQGLRVLYQSGASSPMFPTAFLPSGSELRVETAMHPVGLDTLDYALLFAVDQSGTMRRLGAVGMGAPSSWVSMRAMVGRDAFGSGRGQIAFNAPPSSSLSPSEGLEADDVSVEFTRSSSDQVGPFADSGGGDYVAVLQSAQEGTAEVTCIYLGVDPPLVTDGSGLNSTPQTVLFSP